jgi:hypothetical protein
MSTTPNGLFVRGPLSTESAASGAYSDQYDFDLNMEKIDALVSSGVRSQKTILTAAEIIAMSTTRVQVVPPAGANKIIIPMSVTIVCPASPTPFDDNNPSYTLFYGQSSVVAGQQGFPLQGIIEGPYPFIVEFFGDSGIYAQGNPDFSSVVGAGVYMKETNGGSPTVGNGAFLVTVHYLAADAS